MHHSGLLFHQGKTRTFLAAGECAEAHVGDRILLLATNPDSYLEVAEMLPQNVAQQSQHSNKRFVHNTLESHDQHGVSFLGLHPAFAICKQTIHRLTLVVQGSPVTHALSGVWMSSKLYPVSAESEL